MGRAAFLIATPMATPIATPMAALVTIFMAAMLAGSGARAEDTPRPPAKEYPSGFLSHGDNGDVLEDFFGGRVERKPPEEPGGAHKRDPAIRWDGPATAR